MRGLTYMVCALVCLGCADAPLPDGANPFVKDSGWIGADSYEVEAVVRGTVLHEAAGAWEGLVVDPALQAKLIDQQVKFIKTTAESNGWRLNQLTDSVKVVALSEEDGKVYLEYEAVIDMLGRLNGGVPSLSSVNPRQFDALVPLVPDGFTPEDLSTCAKGDGSHSVRLYNFHYYFAPKTEGCTLSLNTATVEITRVFDRPKVYPEYDKLLTPPETGRTGFLAALLPNRGDNDPMSRFDAHAKMLERQLGLEAKVMEGGLYHRYSYVLGDAEILIDLYDPTKLPWGTGFERGFRDTLSKYTFVHYNGHSNYGNKHLLDDPEAFSSNYQIIMMHSCQSYAYYTRQVFRAKATGADPSGFANADVIATGKSSYPGGSPHTLEETLSSLMIGLDMVLAGQRHSAPDWLTISERMTDSTWGDILYGVAGVRTNAWRP